MVLPFILFYSTFCPNSFGYCYISRISGLAYETVVRIIDGTSQKAQIIYIQALQSVDSEAIGADEFWSNAWKKIKTLPAGR